MAFIVLCQGKALSAAHHTSHESRIVRQAAGPVYDVCFGALVFSKPFEWTRSQVGGLGRQFWRYGPLLTIWNAYTDCLRGFQQSVGV